MILIEECQDVVYTLEWWGTFDYTIVIFGDQMRVLWSNSEYAARRRARYEIQGYHDAHGA